MISFCFYNATVITVTWLHLYMNSSISSLNSLVYVRSSIETFHSISTRSHSSTIALDLSPGIDVPQGEKWDREVHERKHEFIEQARSRKLVITLFLLEVNRCTWEWSRKLILIQSKRLCNSGIYEKYIWDNQKWSVSTNCLYYLWTFVHTWTNF